MGLTDEQLGELLAYHRIKRRSGNVCRNCADESQTVERECFVCGSVYTDKNGVVRQGEKPPSRAAREPDAAFVEMMKGLDPRHRVDRRTLDEKRDVVTANFLKACQERGIKVHG